MKANMNSGLDSFFLFERFRIYVIFIWFYLNLQIRVEGSETLRLTANLVTNKDAIPINVSIEKTKGNYDSLLMMTHHLKNVLK